MKPFLLPALLIALVMVMALLSLAVTPGDGARALPTQANPYVEALRARPIVDPTAAPTETSRPSVGSEPAATLPRVKPAPTSTPRHAVGTPLLAGFATWYDNGGGIYGAAGPDLRRALGDWRGSYVVVTGFTNGQAHSATVPLTDWCLCTGAHQPRLIDLSTAAFERVCGALGMGVCKVEIQWS